MSSHQRPRRIRRFNEEWNEPLAFSQAVRAGNQLWIAGQVAVDEDGSPVGIGDGARQAEQVWHNLASVLEAAGGGLDDLVSTTTWIVDRAYRDAATEARQRWLNGPDYPTNTLLIIDGLGRPEYLIEIAAVAILDDE
ncbi:RidA family protein [Halofilum ochraceum]|uniref:RidA family protein n=1 Tax=Halofilum ochraceum TaxID=1611323 RepID=UPI0008DA8DA3|nr:RidA family protein [Halofilum ochraceum]